MSYLSNMAPVQRARADYIKGQTELRREMAQKKAEKAGMKMLEELMLGPPRGSKLAIDYSTKSAA